MAIIISSGSYNDTLDPYGTYNNPQRTIDPIEDELILLIL